MVMLKSVNGYGVTSVSSQAEVVPGPQPRRGPPKATGDSRLSCSARGGQSNTTGATNQELKVMHWNACGVKLKKEELQEYLRLHKIDVCAIQETHLQPADRFWIRGYECFRQDRVSRKKGGILTLVKTCIPAVETWRSRPDDQSEDLDMETISVEVRLEAGNIQVINIYSPPDKKFQLETELQDNNLVIVGDFNSHSPSWGYSSMDSKGEDVEEWAVMNQLVLVNKPDDPPTFTSRSWRTTHTPDLAFATDDIHKICKRTVGSQLGGSDHRPVIIDLDRKPVEENGYREPSWNLKKANWPLFSIKAEEYTSQMQPFNNINQAVKDFNSAVLQAAKDSIPRGYRKDYKPYWNNKLEELHKNLSTARDEMDKDPQDEKVILHNNASALFRKEKLSQCRQNWHATTTWTKTVVNCGI